MNTMDYTSLDSLSRKPRVSRCQRVRASSITTQPLQIIVEEVEPSPSKPPVSCERKAKRRNCNLSPSDIQIARDFVGLGDEDDVSNCAERLMLVPPQSAKLSPVPSYDSFKINFDDDESFIFPHPPIPTPSSIKSRHFSSSEDDFYNLPSPKFNPRRAGIQSLLNLRPAPAAPCKPSPFTSEESSSESEDEPESDSEWYQNELSKILTVSEPSAPLSQKARPDSIFIPGHRRLSRPSCQLDPAFPSKRQSRQFYVPSSPAPPVPSIPVHLRPVSHLVPSSPISPPSSFMSFSMEPSPTRPPPRSSVPEDFEEFEFEDQSSIFSFSAACQYEDDFKSPWAQASASPLDDAEFDIDLEHDIMLPLSLPGTPIDLEADFNLGLEELQAKTRSRPLPAIPEPKTVTSPTSISDFSFSPSVPLPVRDSWASFYVSEPSSSPPPAVCTFPTPAPAQSKFTIDDEMRVLKSKWSSSTLSSIREEHEKRASATGRMKIFSPTKKHHRTPSKVLSTLLPAAMVPVSFVAGHSRKSSTSHQKAQDAVARATAGVVRPKRDSLDMTHVGVRRRGSCTTIVSDAGSDDSASSSGSSGLRRKPIPYELFLRV